MRVRSPRMFVRFACAALALQLSACAADQPASEAPADLPEQAAVAPAGEAVLAPPILAPPVDDALASVADVQQALRAGLTVVDARPLQAFEAFHIPGAAHVPPHALRTSVALRVDGVVVVGSGHGAGAVPAAVDALREGGRAVRLLDGGMQAWCRAGAPVTGACQDEDLVPAGDLRSLVGCPSRVVVAVVPPDDPAAVDRAKRLIPDAEVVASDDPSEAASRAAAIVRSRGARYLVVLDTDGAGIAALRAALRQATSANVFFVDGGLERARAFESMQAAMLDRRAVVSEGRRSARPAGGGGEEAVVRAPKGCGCR